MSKIVRFIDAKLSAAAAVTIVLLAVVANCSLLLAQHAPPSGFDTPIPAFGSILGEQSGGPNVDTVAGDGPPSAALSSPSGAGAPSTGEGASSETLTADATGSVGRDGDSDDSETAGPDLQLGSAATPASDTISNPSAPTTGSDAASRDAASRGTPPPRLVPSAEFAALRGPASSGSLGVPQRFVPAGLPGTQREETASPAPLPNTPLEEPFPYLPPAVPPTRPDALQEQPALPAALPTVPAALPAVPAALPAVPALPDVLQQPGLQESLPTASPDSPSTDPLQGTLPSVQPGLAGDSLPMNAPNGLSGDIGPEEVLGDGNEQGGQPGPGLPTQGLPNTPGGGEGPKDGSGEEKPEDGGGGKKPKDGDGEEKPKDGGGGKKPKDGGGGGKPKDGGGGKKPKDGGGEEKPKDGGGGGKPKDGGGGGKPKDGGGGGPSLPSG